MSIRISSSCDTFPQGWRSLRRIPKEFFELTARGKHYEHLMRIGNHAIVMEETEYPEHVCCLDDPEFKKSRGESIR